MEVHPEGPWVPSGHPEVGHHRSVVETTRWRCLTRLTCQRQEVLVLEAKSLTGLQSLGSHGPGLRMDYLPGLVCRT